MIGKERESIAQDLMEEKPSDVPLDMINRVNEQRVEELKRMIGEMDDDVEAEMLENAEEHDILNI